MKMIQERFYDKVIKTDKCWNWVGSKNKKGYGSIGKGRRGEGNYRAHRLSFELYKGPIPDEDFVLHSCDNPSCVNPDHLFLGKAKDNTKDMLNKERQFSKLNREQALKIREDTRGIVEIGNEYGVHFSTVSLIKNNKTWKNI